MSIFDSIKDLLGGATDSLQGTVGDVLGGITENPIVQDLQDQAGSITDGASEAVTSVTDQGLTVVEDIKQNLGL